MTYSRLPRPFDASELKRLSAATSDRPALQSAISFATETGLRISELADITRAEAESWPAPRWWCKPGCKHASVLRVIGKGSGTRVIEGGGKERLVVLSPAAVRAAKVMLAHPGSNGRAGFMLPWSIRGFSWLLQGLSDKTGLHVHAHRFRHTHASQLAESGAEPLMIAYMLGHSDIATSMVYIELSVTRRAEALRQRARFLRRAR